MILGPDGSGTNEHFHLAAINFLVVGGAKQWFLTSPEIAGFSNVHPKVVPVRVSERRPSLGPCTPMLNLPPDTHARGAHARAHTHLTIHFTYRLRCRRSTNRRKLR